MNWDYIAGFFDGEGCAGIYKRSENNRVILVHISQKDTSILEELSKFLNDRGIDNSIRPTGKDRSCSRIVINKVGAVYMFITAIKEKVIVKKKRCDEMIKYIEEKKWSGWLTEKEKREIVTLRKKGMSYRKIAKTVGRAPITILKTLQSQNLAERGVACEKLTKDEKDEILKLRKEGLQIKQISSKIGRCNGAIGYVLSQNNITPRGSDYSWYKK